MSKFYVTTSIPYVNAPPHIGHALEFLQADAVARSERLREKEVFFLTGTDEHGQKNYQTALALGKTPQEFIEENVLSFQKLLRDLGISNDDFIRTTDRDRHWSVAQKIWRSLDAEGDIYKKSYKGLYCVGHETFHPEGDLVNGECPDYPGKPLEVCEEENYFFRLSKYESPLKELIRSDGLRVVPEQRKNEILSFIESGLEDVSFSRPKDKLPWGVPVPDDESHVMYVWCDALTNYLSGVDYGEAGMKFQKFWPPDLQIIGKDIVRFHAAIWPAMLLSAKLPLPKTLLVHGFITSGGKKMSKSVGSVVDPMDFLSRYGREPLRYFLFREIPATEDGDFTEERFVSRYNADLANGIGNLVSRTLTLGEKYGREIALKTNDLEADIAAAWERYETNFGRYQFHEALAATWQLISRTDTYLNEKAPWHLLSIQNSEEGVTDAIGHILSSAVIALGNIGWLLRPFLPDTAEKILKSLALDGGTKTPWQGKKIALLKIEQLFPRIERYTDRHQ